MKSYGEIRMTERTITSKKLSIIVQGPIYGAPSDAYENRWTQRACESIRMWFPHAELILSTWRGSDVTNIDFDVLIENEDPGSFEMTINGKLNKSRNMNRQAVSTINGLRAATREYAIKTRTDLVFESDNCLSYFGVYNDFTPEKLVLERIVTLSAAHPQRSGCVYGLNDFFFLGLTSDLIALWDMPPVNPSSLYRRDGCEHADQVDAENYQVIHFWTVFLRRSAYYQDLHIKDCFDINETSLRLTEKALADNVVLLDGGLAGIVSLKYPDSCYCAKTYLRMKYYRHNEWRKLYNKYCGGNLKIRPDLREAAQLALYRFDWRKHLAPYLIESFPTLHRIYRKMRNRNSQNKGARS